MSIVNVVFLQIVENNNVLIDFNRDRVHWIHSTYEIHIHSIFHVYEIFDPNEKFHKLNPENIYLIRKNTSWLPIGETYLYSHSTLFAHPNNNM